MPLVSKSVQTSAWSLSNITNTYEGRVANRKRRFDTVDEGGEQIHVDTRRSNKKAKTVESVEDLPDEVYTPDASYDSREPHDFLAGDWKFEPLVKDSTPTETCQKEDTPFAEPVDVEKVISTLFEVLDAEDRKNHENQNKSKASVNTYHRHFTSPLSGSPDRMPLTRKEVGGICRGRVELPLKKWVLCKNHYDDICAYHPSFRSAEWVEALHEMGWENLHPTYMLQSQQTSRALTAFPASQEDRTDVDDAVNGNGRD